jgi:hypothetical protein
MGSKKEKGQKEESAGGKAACGALFEPNSSKY